MHNIWKHLRNRQYRANIARQFPENEQERALCQERIATSVRSSATDTNSPADSHNEQELPLRQERIATPVRSSAMDSNPLADSLNEQERPLNWECARTLDWSLVTDMNAPRESHNEQLSLFNDQHFASDEEEPPLIAISITLERTVSLLGVQANQLEHMTAIVRRRARDLETRLMNLDLFTLFPVPYVQSAVPRGTIADHAIRKANT